MPVASFQLQSVPHHMVWSRAQGKILEEDVTAYAREIIQGKLKGSDAEEL